AAGEIPPRGQPPAVRSRDDHGEQRHVRDRDPHVAADARRDRRASRLLYGDRPRLRDIVRRFDPETTTGSSAMYEIEIRTLRPTRAVTVAHRGSYMEIGRAFETLFGTLAARNLLTPGIRMIGIFYDDVASVAEENLRSRAAIIGPGNMPIEAPLEAKIIAAGDYAVIRHKGPYSDMKPAYE